ncbi:MAG: hypothetical protein WD534_02380 [Phycisphaeraceae bacterium]
MARRRYAGSGLKIRLGLLALLALLTWPAWIEAAGRYEEFTRKASQSPHAEPVAATHFGSAGHEAFVAASHLPDGAVVAFGNAWGPDYPEHVAPRVLGEAHGRRYDTSPFEDDAADAEPDLRDPNAAGMIVHFNDNLRQVRQITRFEAGIASITHGRVADNGDLIVIGRATDALPDLARELTDHFHIQPAPNANDYGPTDYQHVSTPGHVYVARFSSDASELKWVWLLEGHRKPGQVFIDHENHIVTNTRNLYRITPDGSELHAIDARGGGRTLAISPVDGTILRGGHNNPGTGREPWWRPYVNGFDHEGNHLWEIYGWDGRLVGHDRYRLVSDSYVRAGAFDRQGNMIIAGSSDGGNSVYTRNPVDLDKPVGKNGYGMSSWGMGVGQVSYLVRIEPEHFEVVDMSNWLIYLPERNRPNSVWIHHLQPLPGGSLAFAGAAATGLTETPNAWFRYARDGSRVGGSYVAIFNDSFEHLFYSSYTPGVDITGLGEAQNGVLVFGRSREADGNGNQPPAIHALQGQHAGGRYDAFIALIELP